MTDLFTGPDDACARAQDFWGRIGMSTDPGWQVQLGSDPTAGQLRLTDLRGVALHRSSAVLQSLRRNSGYVGIALSDDSGYLRSTGVVGTRRSVARTVAAARQVAGPLAVMAACQPRRIPAPNVAAAPWRMRSADLAASAWFGLRLSRAALTYRHWACAPVSDPVQSQGRLQLTGSWQCGDSGFWADPFVLTSSGRTWLFMEELDRSTGRGHIVVADVVDGELRDVRTVLANEHHLSFPQVTQHEGRWLATVETCARHNPVYEFEAPGQPWREAPDLPALPAHTADAVVDFAAGTLVGTDAATDGDSVLVRYNLTDRRWIPDPLSLRVDNRWSRGGGTLDPERNVRIVQDCAGTYGVALGWTAADDPDRHMAKWTAADIKQPEDWRGVHTMTWDAEQSQVWIDGWRRRPSPWGWKHRLAEQQHLKSCQG